MNFNDKNDSGSTFVFHTQENQFFQDEILKLSGSDDINQTKQNSHINFPSKGPLIKGKENEGLKSVPRQSKNVVTNHSFNGYFNDNNQKLKNKINQSINKRHQLGDITNKTHQVNSPTNFNSTGKLSNLQFVNDSTKSYSQQSIHLQVINFVKEYFPDNFLTGNFYGKYFSIQNFVEILFEQFYDLIGGQNGYSLVEEFEEKLFVVFGDKIYFEDLFEKTLENGLTGLIFQIVKSINQDRMQNRDLKQNKPLLNPTQMIPPKNSFGNKSLLNSGLSAFKSQIKTQITNFPGETINNSNTCRGLNKTNEIDRLLSGSVSKIKFYDNFTRESEGSEIHQQNFEQVKKILEDYIESMYEEAESKLNKKYSHQIKKITVKYKETEKLLQKINERISNHYDSIQVQKEHEKKIKMYVEKESELEDRIKLLEYELKSAKENLQKQKLNCFKLEQQSIKLKQKLQKYQNAIFQKAMQKDSVNNTSNTSSIMKQTKTNSSIFSQNHSAYQEPISHENLPRFEVKIDTVTEHRPIQIPVIPSQPQTTYVPYLSKQIPNGNLTPTRIKQLQRAPSISPLKQRISFVKTQNPTVNSRIIINPNVQNTNGNSRIDYSTNKKIDYSTNKNTATQKNEANKLKISNVVQIGDKVHLRPLSPIGKLTDQNSIQTSAYTAGNQPMNNLQTNQNNFGNQPMNNLQTNQNNFGNQPMSNLQTNQNNFGNQPMNNLQTNQNNFYGQRTYSPIKVQFCTSRVTAALPQNK